MEELFLVAGIIILVVLSILPYVSIIGTWTEIKQVNNKLEETNQILEVLTKSVMEMKERQKIKDHSNSIPAIDSAQGEWLGSEQTKM